MLQGQRHLLRRTEEHHNRVQHREAVVRDGKTANPRPIYDTNVQTGQRRGRLGEAQEQQRQRQERNCLKGQSIGGASTRRQGGTRIDLLFLRLRLRWRLGRLHAMQLLGKAKGKQQSCRRTEYWRCKYRKMGQSENTCLILEIETTEAGRNGCMKCNSTAGFVRCNATFTCCKRRRRVRI